MSHLVKLNLNLEVWHFVQRENKELWFVAFLPDDLIHGETRILGLNQQMRVFKKQQEEGEGWTPMWDEILQTPLSSL